MRVERIGSATLYCGDCREVLPTLSGVAAVVTDPPYGIDYQSGHATPDLWKGGRRIIADYDVSVRDQALAYWQGCAMPRLVFGSRKAKPPYETRMVLIWDKGPALGMGALDLPWKPSYEEIYVLGTGFVSRPRNEGAVIYCPPVQSMACNGRVHPTEKPLQLIKRLLLRCPTGIVLDPFMGSGTTGVACANLRRSFIGIEIHEPYFDIACRRIEQAQRQGDLFRGAPVAEDAADARMAELFEHRKEEAAP